MAEERSVDKKTVIEPQKLLNKKYYRTINIDVALEEQGAPASAPAMAKVAKLSNRKSVENEIDLMKLAKISNPQASEDVAGKTAKEEKADDADSYKALLKGMGFNVK